MQSLHARDGNNGLAIGVDRKPATRAPQLPTRSPLISIVVPAHDEGPNVGPLVERLTAALAPNHRFEVIFVDDGSTDDTLARVKALAEVDPRVKFVSLSRNFGHQVALKAGVDHAEGDCVVMMDADLQHPPELVPEMIERWRSGCEVVQTRRHDRMLDGWFKTVTSRLFYRLINHIAEVPVPTGAADFRLVDRRVVEVLKGWREQTLFWRGVVSWMGFRTEFIDYRPHERHAGRSKYTLRTMAALSFTAVVATSIKPLRMSIAVGGVFALASVAYGIYAIVARFAFESAVPGWASIVTSVMFVGGVQLIMLGILGHYIGQLVVQSRGRPTYIVRESLLGGPGDNVAVGERVRP
jgi:dolichol-phosphate mannosyltransferase